MNTQKTAETSALRKNKLTFEEVQLHTKINPFDYFFKRRIADLQLATTKYVKGVGILFYDVDANEKEIRNIIQDYAEFYEIRLFGSLIGFQIVLFDKIFYADHKGIEQQAAEYDKLARDFEVNIF